MKEKRSFFERLTGSISVDDESDFEDEVEESAPTRNMKPQSLGQSLGKETFAEWAEEDPAEGQLSVDVYQTPTHMVIKAMVAGVKREDIDISIARDMITIRGKREEERGIEDGDYFHKELYWGSFSRTIMLANEVEIEGAEAIENSGMLTIKLPRIDKEKKGKLRVMKAQGY